MTTIGAFEAKTHLSKLLERANQGEVIIITRRGEPYATLGPIEPAHDVDEARAAIARMRTFARQNAIPGLTTEEIISWIEEGRE